MPVQVMDCSGCMDHELLTESEDSSLPLIRRSGVAAPSGTAIATEQQRAVTEAVTLIQTQLVALQGQRQPSKSEISDSLRELCQNLSDLAMGLEQTWQKIHPGEPQPRWAVEDIPEEEFARIRWDFHSNRVQIANAGGSFWNAMSYLMSGDQKGGFAKPPSAPEVREALARTMERLEKETWTTPNPSSRHRAGGS